MSTRRLKSVEVRAPRMRRANAPFDAAKIDWDQVRPATREETMPIMMGAILLGVLSLIICFSKGYLLLYGDAVAHLGIARRILDTRNPGLVQLGGVWLPFPHLLMVPLVQKMEWWQSGLAGAWPSLASYVLSVVALYRLSRRMLRPRWALVATVFYAVNPNLLYLATTAMTEPLFLAIILWLTLWTVECMDAIRGENHKIIVRRLIGLGVLILFAVFTRYDGWIFGAAVWCVVTWKLVRSGALKRVLPAFVVFTLLAVSGPLLWFWYNQHFYHDPLDFMRGPYSAPAIEKKTSPPGSRHYRGWHNPAWALLFYTRTAQVVASAWESGFALMLAALAGLWIVVRRKFETASSLLWVPLPFYVYSVAYGSVPIFIPQLWPHSYYNARYGMEMLPVLALFASVAANALEDRWRTSVGAPAGMPAPESGSKRWHILYPAVMVLALLNSVLMMYGVSAVQWTISHLRHRPSHALAIYAPPLVLKEAIVNATTRVPFERDLALALDDLPPGATILMQESDHIGALQDAGIPLKQTINESDWDSWHAALEDPAGHAQYVVALDGDAVAKAVKQHPQNLQELTILCGSGQPCARIYQSEHPAPTGAPASK